MPGLQNVFVGVCVCVCVCGVRRARLSFPPHLQWTIMGLVSEYLWCWRTLRRKNKMGVVCRGTPKSGQDRKWNCTTFRFSVPPSYNILMTKDKESYVFFVYHQRTIIQKKLSKLILFCKYFLLETDKWKLSVLFRRSVSAITQFLTYNMYT